MVIREKALSPRQVRDELLEIRSKLCQEVAAVAAWRRGGLEGGQVPVSVLPIEGKLEKCVQEVESCIRVLMYLEKQGIINLLEE